jgi:hypothetical protein
MVAVAMASLMHVECLTGTETDQHPATDRADRANRALEDWRSMFSHLETNPAARKVVSPPVVARPVAGPQDAHLLITLYTDKECGNLLLHSSLALDLQRKPDGYIVIDRVTSEEVVVSQQQFNGTDVTAVFYAFPTNCTQISKFAWSTTQLVDGALAEEVKAATGDFFIVRYFDLHDDVEITRPAQEIWMSSGGCADMNPGGHSQRLTCRQAFDERTGEVTVGVDIVTFSSTQCQGDPAEQYLMTPSTAAGSDDFTTITDLSVSVPTSEILSIIDCVFHTSS